MDYEREYDTTKVETPENRRGMVRILERYTKFRDGGSPVYEDPEGTDDMAVSVYLRVLADYSDTASDKPEGLEAAYEIWEKNKDSDTYFTSLFDHLRYIDLIYLSPDKGSDAWPAFCMIGVDGEEAGALPVFTRRKLISKEIMEGMYTHHASIFDLLDVCEAEDINDIMINPDTTDETFEADNLKACIEEYEEIDKFWKSLRRGGVTRDDLFPLLITDFLYRTVRCIYGDGQEAIGTCVPYAEGHNAPMFFIDTESHEMVRVPLAEIQFLQELPDEEEEE